MSRQRLILGSLAALVIAVLVFGVVGSLVAPTFQRAGASLGGGSAPSTVAQRPVADAVGRTASEGVRGAPAAPPAGPAAQTLALPSLDRLIIRTVSMTLVVPNAIEAYRQVEQIALEQGGLVSGSQLRQEGERTLATVTLRVPADGRAYQATLDRLRGLADRVLDEQGQTQDVSEEYVDLEARLRNLRATEGSLLVLYEKAVRLEDVFAVQREVTGIRGQIEQIEGRKRALESKASLATITLQIREPAGLAPRHRDWSPVDVAGDALAAVARVLRGASTVAIWALVWLPLYGLPLLALWLLRGRLRALVGPRGTAGA